MTLIDFLTATGSLAGVVGGLTAFAKYVADKSAEAGMKRFEHVLKLAEADHKSELSRREAEFSAKLHRIEEEHRAAVQFATSLDLELRRARTASYSEVWAKTVVVPKWPRNDRLEYADLLQLSKALRDWYFSGGGVLLSADSQAAYRSAQQTIHHHLGAGKSGLVPDPEYDRVRDALSALRTELTDDLLSRRAAPKVPAGEGG
jgi:hypothetical protein